MNATMSAIGKGLRYGVAKVTVRQALGTLAAAGLIERIQGKGTFVADAIKKPKLIQLDSNWQGLVRTLDGRVPKARAGNSCWPEIPPERHKVHPR
jgi:Bacterial regulatory proteins, gntR family